MFSGHAGVSIGSVTHGGLRNVTVRDCVFNGTNRGLYIKSRRGRGGLIEDIHYHNISMPFIYKEAIAIALIYNGTDDSLRNRDIQKEAITATTPMVRNIEYNGIHGYSVRNPILLIGLPESKIENVTFVNCKIESKQNIFLNNTHNVIINGNKITFKLSDNVALEKIK